MAEDDVSAYGSLYDEIVQGYENDSAGSGISFVSESFSIEGITQAVRRI